MKKHLSRTIFIIISICLAPVTGQPCIILVLDNNGQAFRGKNFVRDMSLPGGCQPAAFEMIGTAGWHQPGLLS